MKTDGQRSPAVFDEFAGTYDAALNRGLSMTGESKDYYARRRVEWLAKRLRRFANFTAPMVMDFGCGTGTTAPDLLTELKAASLLGLDVSEPELSIARAACPPDRTSFKAVADHTPDGNIDIIYCNGTFHHIPPPERAAIVRMLFDSLKPGGYFGLWENNPWNPGTRIVMSKIPFDKDAIMLSMPEARRLLRSAGFQIVSTDTLFYFPRSLGFLRPLEPLLSVLPLGGQYMVLARKP